MKNHLGRQVDNESNMKTVSGKGTIAYDNGDFYDGAFENSEPQGVGKMTYEDGRVCEGIWRNGKIEYEGDLVEVSRTEEAKRYVRTATCMRENGKAARGMVRDHSNGPMEVHTREIGRKISVMARGS
mmetsp:Transcript_17749/g.35556  ORF Transcript_17749/g.35556 Transcript_17749/m.35556 type:complete len:127 (+) Transcript_17749:125-505(+)